MQEQQPSIFDKTIWVALTLASSAATYRFIEKPFRSNRISRRLLFSILSLAVLVVISLSGYWIKVHGVVNREGYLNSVIDATRRQPVYQSGIACNSGSADKRWFALSGTCIFTEFPGSCALVLVGGSHADSLAESVHSLALKNDLNYVQITQDGSPHISGYPDLECAKRSARPKVFLATPDSPIIIYNARVPLFLEQERFDN